MRIESTIHTHSTRTHTHRRTSARATKTMQPNREQQEEKEKQQKSYSSSCSSITMQQHEQHKASHSPTQPKPQPQPQPQSSSSSSSNLNSSTSKVKATSSSSLSISSSTSTSSSSSQQQQQQQQEYSKHLLDNNPNFTQHFYQQQQQQQQANQNPQNHQNEPRYLYHRIQNQKPEEAKQNENSQQHQQQEYYFNPTTTTTTTTFTPSSLDKSVLIATDEQQQAVSSSNFTATTTTTTKLSASSCSSSSSFSTPYSMQATSTSTTNQPAAAGSAGAGAGLAFNPNPNNQTTTTTATTTSSCSSSSAASSSSSAASSSAAAPPLGNSASISSSMSSAAVSTLPPPPTSTPFIQGHGHYFSKKTFHKPTYCHHCADMLWGLIGQGYICEVCNFVVHERCMRTVVSCCSTVASSAIKNPMPHCWTDAHPKRKFCNVCRKRIEDNALAARCSVCEYCVHLECQEFSISDCRECATYVPDQSLQDVCQQHHWREGNLPQNSSKCYWCRKSCFSAECLTGMRCEWCQITVHASCLKNSPRDCNLGCLQSIMLPPYCISIPRTDVPMETIIGVQNRFNLQAATNMAAQYASALASGGSMTPGLGGAGGGGFGAPGSAGSSLMLGPGGQVVGVPSGVSALATKRDNLSPRSTSEDFNQLASLYYQQQEDLITRDKDEELLRIYDGNSSIKKRSFRLISVHRAITRENLIAACLRAFYIHDDVSHYTLFDITDGEREIIDYSVSAAAATTTPTGTNIGINPGGGANFDQQPQQQLSPLANLVGRQQLKDKQQLLRPPAILLRYRPPDSSMGCIKVYPGRLNVTDLTYCNVMVTSDTSVDEIMIQALDKFKLPSNDLNRYRLVEVSLDKGSSVHERTMDNQECPWEIIKNVARESVRQKENTRFYLQQQDEVYCSSVAIFVGNLPTNLSQKQYEAMLMEHLGKPYRFKQINPIYYEHGSCIITYDNADIAVKAFYMLRESTVKVGDELRNLVVLLLPNIVPEMIPEGVRPLLVFVNVKSGGCQGLDLITSFRRLLNPYQVYDLENGGPLPGLYVFRKIRDYKILVSGGDGSVGWVLQCLDNVGQDSECQSPPCAIIPLGTGNDLARVLRWGSGYTGAEDSINFLKDIIDAEEVILDRWTVVFHSDEASKQEFPSALTMTPGTGSGAEDNAAIFVMNNYLGIGLDADLCLGFHNAREENPNKFNSRLHNKGVYVKQAIKKMVNRSSWDNLNKAIKLEVDGKPIPLPHIEGMIILNILSWGSGANPWGPEVEERFSKPTHYDGMLEVVGITGIVHMGQIQSGLSRAIRIAQGGKIKIRLNTEMPIQVDGEPWIQSACDVNIMRSALKATMLRKNKMKRRNTEPSINQDLDVSEERD